MEDALSAWFERFGRDLPWRRTRDPYAILVSEVMLQQTQVARVVEQHATRPVDELVRDASDGTPDHGS